MLGYSDVGRAVRSHSKRVVVLVSVAASTATAWLMIGKVGDLRVPTEGVYGGPMAAVLIASLAIASTVAALFLLIAVLQRAPDFAARHGRGRRR